MGKTVAKGKARSAERHGSNQYRQARCRHVACEAQEQELAKLRQAAGGWERELRHAKRTWGAEIADHIATVTSSVERLRHELTEQSRARDRERRKSHASTVRELESKNAALQAELTEMLTDLGDDMPWKKRYLNELERYRGVAKELKELKADSKREITSLKMAQERLQRVATSAESSAAAAAAEAVDANRSTAAVNAKLQAVMEASTAATLALADARREVPRGPKSYTDEQWVLLTDDAARQARSREMRFLSAVFDARTWRGKNIATVLQQHALLLPVLESKEVQEWFSIEVRELLARCESVHWGVNYGMFLHLEEKCPSRRVRRMRAAGAETYDPETDRGKRKPLWINSHKADDVIYVPYTVPAPTAYADEVEEYASAHGLKSNADGTAAVQSIDLLIPHLITRDHHRQPELAWFEQHGFKVLMQGDGARRGIKSFCQWIFKNQYLSSESAAVLHLFALGLGYKDDATGAVSVWGDELDTVRSIDGRTWYIPDPSHSDPDTAPRIFKITTSLEFTLDLHAERLFFGITNGGCLCRGDELHHAYPRNRRQLLTTITLVLEWVARCREPTMFEQNALAHEPQPDEPCPGKCPGCSMYDGNEAQRLATFEREDAKVRARTHSHPRAQLHTRTCSLKHPRLGSTRRLLQPPSSRTRARTHLLNSTWNTRTSTVTCAGKSAASLLCRSRRRRFGSNYFTQFPSTLPSFR